MNTQARIASINFHKVTGELRLNDALAKLNEVTVSARQWLAKVDERRYIVSNRNVKILKRRAS